MDLLELFKTGGQKLQNFVDDIWKEIVEWFLKNKEIIEGKLKKIKEYLKKSRKLKFRTTKMLKKYVGEEKGTGWCAPNAVKYLDDIERLEYELAIVDGKLYSKNGKLFDTAFAGTERELTQKAIFVMNKEGRIYATNNYPRFQFHHSSFLSGAEVAAAGELKVVNGVVQLVS